MKIENVLAHASANLLQVVILGAVFGLSLLGVIGLMAGKRAPATAGRAHNLFVSWALFLGGFGLFAVCVIGLVAGEGRTLAFTKSLWATYGGASAPFGIIFSVWVAFTLALTVSCAVQFMHRHGSRGAIVYSAGGWEPAKFAEMPEPYAFNVDGTPMYHGTGFDVRGKAYGETD